MKVLFAVSNENISEAVIKKYQKQYKEIITYKNVYYFNAIIKELQRDKTYDRIVISEDLEPFTNKNYDAIDKFLFEKLDNISDEATNSGTDIPIILICSDRRTKSEAMLVRIFGIGVYNALLGQDRSVDKVCQLIYMPRSKKEAKIYYKIESEDVNYQVESDDTVSEIEVQNILSHFKKISKNPERFVDSFNNIAAQYNDAQLRVIAKVLPLNVKTVLEEESPKYQSVMTFGDVKRKRNVEQPKEDGLKMNFIGNASARKNLSRPVVVPGVSNSKKVVKLETTQETGENATEQKATEVTQKRRGRPKKITEENNEINNTEVKTESKKGRGRPKKVVQEVEEPEINLFDIAEKKEEDLTLPGFDETSNDDNILPGFNNTEENNELPSFNNSDENNSYNSSNEEFSLPGFNNQNSFGQNQIQNILTKEKKLVAFVGTSKNGISFIVNNLACLLSQMGIDTAILDMTKNKNSYFIYTQNEENLRKKASSCFDNLQNGNADGITINKNLTVYTTIPDNSNRQINHTSLLETIVKKHSLILIDCDFDTPLNYFKEAQEIYLVQSMDILTIQPLTAFLRELKTQNVLDPNKIRIIINKQIKVGGLNSKVLIGGMAFYNDPAMSFMTELFNKDTVLHCDIPFETQTYSKYLEGLVNCEISLKGYSKIFLEALKKLAEIVYPLLNNKYIRKNDYSKNNKFSSDMNNTLDKMKNKY